MKVDIAIIMKIADAFAFAEGFYVKDSRPARNHNPGDFETDITGEGVGRDGPYVVYPSDEAGWKALYRQIQMMFGGSHIYNFDMTIQQIASHWTTTEQGAWAANVAKRLGITIDTSLADIR